MIGRTPTLGALRGVPLLQDPSTQAQPPGLAVRSVAKPAALKLNASAEDPAITAIKDEGLKRSRVMEPWLI